ncbi:MAG: SDR family NAD(P)-dependent oxidoreductase [Lachnospiraceae bacterium]|nr:SDR family NAD(P)-dependent oxidoreductase [Lachnospiraceae bacterium]
MKIAIVTGASSGMGKEFVRQIDERCYGLDEIWMLARRREEMEELNGQTQAKLRIFPVDVSDKVMLGQFEECLAIEQPNVKILVNCAGYGKTGAFDHIGKEENLGMIDVNCRGLTAVTYSVLPYMTRHSYIIHLASAAAFLPQPDFAVYAATKSYVLSFSRALRREVMSRGICVSAVCPGPVKTDFFRIAEQTGETFALKKFFYAQKEKVVRQALLGAFRKKEVIVYSLPMQGFCALTKALPHRVLLDVYSKMLGIDG